MNDTIYSAIFFDEFTRAKLKELAQEVFKTSLEEEKLHHITLCFGKDVFEYGKEVKFKVTGYSKDELCQAFLVLLNDNINVNHTLHITVSHSKQVSPKYSNEILNKVFCLDKPREFIGKIGRFTKSGIIYE